MSKKYKNPIPRVEKVTIPAWEYKQLVASHTLTNVTIKLVNNLEDYKLKDALNALFRAKGEDENDF